MKDDPRCCGTGTCIINDKGYCWCGQRWDGEKMCFDQSDYTKTVSMQESTSDEKRVEQNPAFED